MEGASSRLVMFSSELVFECFPSRESWKASPSCGAIGGGLFKAEPERAEVGLNG
jgi:hypothetical protein